MSSKYRQIRLQKRQMKVRSQLLASFLIMSIIPVLLVAIFSYFFSYNAILQNTVTYAESSLSSASSEIDGTILAVQNLAESLQNDPTIQSAMRNKLLHDPHETINTIEINTILTQIQSYSTPQIYGIYCANDRGKQYKSNINSLAKEDVRSEAWYINTTQNVQDLWINPKSGSPMVIAPNLEAITYVAPFIDKLTGECVGAVIIDLKVEDFSNILQNTQSFDATNSYILDANDNLILGNNHEPTLGDVNGNALTYQVVLSNGWCMISSISNDVIVRQSAAQLTLTMVILILITIPSAVLYSIIMSKRISSPINTLMNLMKEIEKGNFDVYMQKNDTSYEMQNLRKSFNKMAKNGALYVKQIGEEQKKLREAHFAALQAQISPHFLYNTLDTIAWNVRMDEKEKSVSAIFALTKFFRASLSDGEQIISLKKELDQVDLYLQIQNFRYSDTMTYSIEMNKEHENLITPKLILQPIVENALYHGIKPKGSGHIDITVAVDSELIVISISDNGEGMDAVDVNNLNDFLQSKHGSQPPKSKSGYGIKNVNERIKIYFGKKYGLFYTSEKNVGTTAFIVLPKLISENEISSYFSGKDN